MGSRCVRNREAREPDVRQHDVRRVGRPRPARPSRTGARLADGALLADGAQPGAGAQPAGLLAGVGATGLGATGLAAAPRPTGARGLALCAALHGVVDGACGLLLWRAVRDGLVTGGAAWALFVGYIVLAFAIQPLLGAAVDKLDAAWPAVGCGALLVAASLATLGAGGSIMAALPLAGLGNSAFHAGGGRLSLRIAPGRASSPGLFVAPGAVGLLVGVAAGKAGAPLWPAVVVLVALAAPIPWASRQRPTPTRAQRPGRGADCLVGRPMLPTVGVLLVVVAIRSYLGMGVALPWRTETSLLVALTIGVVAGKAFGGIAADLIGWRAVGCGALLVAGPLLVAAPQHPIAGILGMTVFNLTMPITVAAAALVLPGDEGFAIGLTCLALFVGAVPALLGWAVPVDAPTLVLAVAAATAALWWALRPPQDHLRPQKADRTRTRSAA